MVIGIQIIVAVGRKSIGTMKVNLSVNVNS